MTINELKNRVAELTPINVSVFVNVKCWRFSAGNNDIEYQLGVVVRECHYVSAKTPEEALALFVEKVLPIVQPVALHDNPEALECVLT